ncbi:hemin uptake protein HemP [Vreelandella venusta]|uniref:hemin uptake protein HemP n=1 Tax=Vreelandella TaxID=3137766 RepID=UPI00200D91F5|nr:hemin uptake protein HemP [Halomonas venusta]UQI40180.1 hemin uptake protein HemP [Halomonas venusta]
MQPRKKDIPPEGSPSASREVTSQALLDQDGQLVIHHEQRRYVLRRTKSGKLILTA